MPKRWYVSRKQKLILCPREKIFCSTLFNTNMWHIKLFLTNTEHNSAVSFLCPVVRCPQKSPFLSAVISCMFTFLLSALKPLLTAAQYHGFSLTKARGWWYPNPAEGLQLNLAPALVSCPQHLWPVSGISLLSPHLLPALWGSLRDWLYLSLHLENSTPTNCIFIFLYKAWTKMRSISGKKKKTKT